MISELDTSNCVLFLGSGFSADGVNILGKGPPVGDNLRLEFIELLGDPSYNNYDLQTVSEAVAEDQNIDLYQEIYNRFTIKELPEKHKAILCLPWRRIYTTNYDDAVELTSNARATYNYDEPKPRKIPEGAIVHLHGVIRSTNPENVMDQLVLGERSYVRQHIEKSPWYEEFDRDVRFSEATFFLGYSLRDQHITALLMKNPATIKKVHFVTRGQPDKPTASKFEQYGTVLPLGINGFSDFIHQLPKPTPAISEPNQLRALRFLDPLQDRAAIVPPTATEVRHFLTFGSFNFKRMIAGLNPQSYAVGRSEEVRNAIRALGTARTLVVDARLGNGKTIFLYLLAAALSETGYKCFLCRSDATGAARDLESLRAMGKVAIFFDSYGLALDLIQEFAGLSEAVFVVAVRSSVRAVQMHEILKRFPAPISSLDINRLRPADREAFSALVNTSGLLSGNFEQKATTAKDLRELVLILFDNAQVRGAIEREILPHLNNPQVRKVFLASYLLKQSGYDADPVFIRDLTGVDPYQVLFSVEAAAEEVFDLADNLQMRSAVFASYLVDTFFDPKELLLSTESLIVLSTLRRDELTPRRLSGALMQISFLSRLFSRLPNYQGEMRDLFERLRNNTAINSEPLFWLQYAILMMDDDRAIAESFIATAYKRAGARQGFLTYQIDTFALRLSLQAESAESADRVIRFDNIVEKLNLVISMLGEASHRYYAINVLDDLEPFVAARHHALTITQKNRLVYDLSRAIQALKELSAEYRAQSGSDATKNSVERAKQYLLG